MDKEIVILFIISLLFLFLVSSVNAADDYVINMTAISNGCDNHHIITSNLSNDDIQSKFDNANSGDTFEFTDREYKNISLVVDKKLNIISKCNSVVYTSGDGTKNSGFDKTFGFYFTSNSTGSLLSGLTIVAFGSDCGVIVDNAKNVVVKDNRIAGGKNCILLCNADKITISDNDISNAQCNGLQLKNVRNSLIGNNIISYNGMSGIETSNIYRCNITKNTIHHNGLNGISTFNESSDTLINRNNIYENTNGIYINSTSKNDAVKSNSVTYSRKNPRSSMGGFETGNGFLLGAGFKSSGSSLLKVEYNYLAHNEFYQAKNYWENENFELGQNWYDSNDPSNTFVCPRLLASLMNLDSFTVSNTLTFQLRDSSGRAVNEFATFQSRVNVDGNEFMVTFENGRAVAVENLDPNVDHNVQIEIGSQFYDYDYKASGEKGQSTDSQTVNRDDETGAERNSGDNGTCDVDGNSNYQGNSQGGNSSGSHVKNSHQSGNYGTNSSSVPSQDTSEMGNDALSNGDLNAGNTGSGSQSKEGKAYEIIPPVTTSKELTNTSGLVVLSIMSLMGCFILGYRRKFDENEFD